MRIVFITGAARGIGFSTACHLAKADYRVYALVKESSDKAALDKAIEELGPQLVKVVGDVTEEDSINKVIQEIIRSSARIDIVINNACHVVVGTCETCTIEEQQKTMDVNYFGPIRVLQSTLPYMRAQRSGHIINISSVSGYEPFPYLESYVASKFALEGLSESLASHLAPWNILVSLIEPGGVKTEAPQRAAFGSRKLKDTDAYKKYCEQAKKGMEDSYNQSLETHEIACLIKKIRRKETTPSLSRGHFRYSTRTRTLS